MSEIKLIVQNKKAHFDYFIEEQVEAGVMLEGWEIKAIRGGKAQLTEAYVIVKNGELFLLGAHISPLISASTHIEADPVKTRKLLMHKNEIGKMVEKVQKAGYTLIPVDMHYTNGRVKVSVGIAKGKKQHDKRMVEREREDAIETRRAVKQVKF